MLVFLFVLAQGFLAVKYLHEYQMSGYRFEGSRKLLEKFLVSDPVCLLFVLDVIFPDLHTMLTVSVCLYLMLVSVLTMGKKTPLKFTRRMTRNFICTAVLLFGFNFGLFLCFPNWLLASGLVTGPLVWLSCLVMLPLENAVRRSYVKRAGEKLRTLPAKVVGITGSFGKTTTKDMLFDLLKDSFRVVKTPNSYNTEMGVAMTILNQVDETTQILICEMGARRPGDIQALCDIAPPDCSILTSIGFCHYKTFGSIENICRTKFEICRNTKDFCVFGEGEHTRELYLQAPCGKVLAGSGDYAFRSVGINSFYLKLAGKEHFFRTNLVGTVHQKNLALALITAFRLGVSAEDLKLRCLSLTPTPHRLELIRNGSVTILDDSYNSNISGIRGMVEVVKTFSGRKILVTCGMVELGKLQYEQNREFARLCGVFDFLFIISRTNRRAFRDGLAEIGFDPSRVVYFRKLADLEEFLKTFMRGNDLIVFENDLPDNYR